MSEDEAKEIVIEAMNYAAYRETDHSLFDSDKNRLFGSEHYTSGRPIAYPSPWEGSEFERKMMDLLRRGSELDKRNAELKDALALLSAGDSYLGSLIRLSGVQ